MKYKTRTFYTKEQQSQMWDRWREGESLQAIAELFNRNYGSVAGILSRTGGIRPKERTRSRLSLMLSEREDISRGIAAELSIRSIAANLGRSPSTISREINRNGGYYHYRAAQADQSAWERAHRPKPCKLAGNAKLRRTVATKLKNDWSPKQIAGWLKITFPDDENHQVSHETIYRSLFIQARGVLKKELQQYLRTQRVMRRSKHHSIKNKGLAGAGVALPLDGRAKELAGLVRSARTLSDK